MSMGSKRPGWKTIRNRYSRITREMQRAADEERAERNLFAGVYPCGIVYADRSREVGGDYKRLAFLPYRELELQFEKDCTPAFRTIIRRDAAPIQARRGQQFEVSACGQTVMLGA